MANLEIKTATRYIEVFLDGVFVSRHLTVEDAIESAVNRGNGDYRIVYPERLVKVYGILNPLTGDTQAPTVPGNPQLVSKGATFVTLSWAASTDNIGVTGYQIRRGGTPIATTVSTSYTNSGLTPSTQYSYTVEAYDAAGNNSGTTGQTPLVTTTNANSAPVWNAPQQELTTNVSYNLTLTSVCSDADGNPITFAQVSGTLPTGVAFNAGSGIVSGTPTTVQSPSVTFSASDGIAAPVNQAIVFNVLNPDVTAPNVPTLNTPTSVTSSSMTVTANATTDPTVANARTSGVATYTLQRATDSGFTTGVVTESPQAGTTWNLTGLSASTQYWFRARATDAAGNVSAYGSSVNATTQTTGYTPTHYVAPYTSVSGASNDYDNLGSAAYNSATNSGTPTTLGTAMANAVAPHKVRVAPGTYAGNHTGDRWSPSFRAAATNSTADNPLVFFAQYPAATNYGSTSLYSTLRKTGTLTGTDNPVLGVVTSNSCNHIIFDGFHANEANALAAPNGGVFQLASTTGTQLRRCVIDRGSGTVSYPAGYNGNSYYVEATQNCKMLDCICTGFARRSPDGSIYRHSSFELYNSTGFEMMYCYYENFGQAVYQKESDNQWSTSCTYRYNKFYNGSQAIGVQQGAMNCDHNLAIDVDTGFYGDGGPVTYQGGTRPPQVLNVHHDTYIIRATPFEPPYSFGAVVIENGMQIRTSSMRDMLVFAKSGWAYRHFEIESGGSSSWAWSDWTTLNNNLYYREGGGTPTFRGLAFNAMTGLPSWQTETSREANSLVSDPQFVNAAVQDFRLANNGQAALTASSTGGRVGCYETGNEEIGVRANPTY